MSQLVDVWSLGRSHQCVFPTSIITCGTVEELNVGGMLGFTRLEAAKCCRGLGGGKIVREVLPARGGKLSFEVPWGCHVVLLDHGAPLLPPHSTFLLLLLVLVLPVWAPLPQVTLPELVECFVR